MLTTKVSMFFHGDDTSTFLTGFLDNDRWRRPERVGGPGEISSKSALWKSNAILPQEAHEHLHKIISKAKDNIDLLDQKIVCVQQCRTVYRF